MFDYRTSEDIFSMNLFWRNVWQRVPNLIDLIVFYSKVIRKLSIQLQTKKAELGMISEEAI